MKNADSQANWNRLSKGCTGPRSPGKPTSLLERTQLLNSRNRQVRFPGSGDLTKSNTLWGGSGSLELRLASVNLSAVRLWVRPSASLSLLSSKRGTIKPNPPGWG